MSELDKVIDQIECHAALYREQRLRAEIERLCTEIERLRANEKAQMDGALALLAADKNLRDGIARLRAAWHWAAPHLAAYAVHYPNQDYIAALDHHRRALEGK